MYQECNKGKWTIVILLLAIVFAACQKKTEGVITVTTKEVTEINGNSAKTGGKVESSGYTIGECGVCYGESHTPTINDNFTKDHDGNGEFKSSISDLKSGSKYYVRAYAKTSSGIEYGDEKSFTTQEGCMINVFADPTAGGTVTGAGTYPSGQQCTVTATPKTNYKFTKWTVNSSQVSTNATYSFTVTGNKDLVAHFEIPTYTISASASPASSGTVTGAGSYPSGQSCTLKATANSGYAFDKWTEDGNEVSTNANYTFTVSGARNLVAHFVVSLGLPSVTTTAVTNITQTKATGGGDVTDDGGSSVTRRGLCWSTSSNPTLESGSSIASGSGTGSFTKQITGLTPNTYYYIRAYATNSVGTSYGNQQTFRTASSATSDTWLYYDDDLSTLIHGYTYGGTLEWAVMFPTSMLAPYEGMYFTKVKVCVGLVGTYYFTIYTGGDTPSTQVYNGYCDLDNTGWWDITFDIPSRVTAKNTWISVSNTHEAGEYPAGSSNGSNTPNGRWVNLSSGWCDAYTSGWVSEDLNWNIRAYVSNSNKGQEIELPQFEATSHQCKPRETTTSKGTGSHKKVKLINKKH